MEQRKKGMQDELATKNEVGANELSGEALEGASGGAINYDGSRNADIAYEVVDDETGVTLGRTDSLEAAEKIAGAFGQSTRFMSNDEMFARRGNRPNGTRFK